MNYFVSLWVQEMRKRQNVCETGKKWTDMIYTRGLRQVVACHLNDILDWESCC